MKKIRAMFDGCCEPTNPHGNMGMGAIIYFDNFTEFEFSEFIPAKKGNSNNVAEYIAFTATINYFTEWHTEHGLPVNCRIDIRGDSKMVVNQMNGLWKIKFGFYAEYAIKAKEIWMNLRNVCKEKNIPLTLQWIPREMNDVADKLSKAHLIQNGVEFRIQPNE